MPDSLFDDVEDAEFEEGAEGDEEDELDDDSPENPVTNRGEEARPEQAPPGVERPGPPPGGTAPRVRVDAQRASPSRRLIMVFDSSGKPKVALTVNGQRVENFRTPTPQEWALFKQRGYMVKGGLSGDPAATDGGGGLVGMLRRNAGTLALLAAVAVGGGVYWWQQKKGGGVDGEDDGGDDEYEDVDDED